MLYKSVTAVSEQQHIVEELRAMVHFLETIVLHLDLLLWAVAVAEHIKIPEHECAAAVAAAFVEMHKIEVILNAQD